MCYDTAKIQQQRQVTVDGLSPHQHLPPPWPPIQKPPLPPTPLLHSLPPKISSSHVIYPAVSCNATRVAETFPGLPACGVPSATILICAWNVALPGPPLAMAIRIVCAIPRGIRCFRKEMIPWSCRPKTPRVSGRPKKICGCCGAYRHMGWGTGRILRRKLWRGRDRRERLRSVAWNVT